jgi:hypothetical protein
MQLIDNWSSCALVIGRGELTEKGEVTLIFESPNLSLQIVSRAGPFCRRSEFHRIGRHIAPLSLR